MFSVPGENQPPPDDSRMPTEMQPDSTHPTDGRQSAEGVADVVKSEALIPIHFTSSRLNVSNPPTLAQLNEAFGARSTGDAFIVIDGGGGQVWLAVQAEGDEWWYEGLTQAV